MAFLTLLSAQMMAFLTLLSAQMMAFLTLLPAQMMAFLTFHITGVHMAECTKTQTPYGMRLAWELPTHHEDGSRGMVFVIHLKDNQKVGIVNQYSVSIIQ